MPPRFKAPCSLWRAFADFCSTCGVGGVANLGWGSFSYPQSSHWGRSCLTSRWGRSCLTSRLRTSPTTTPSHIVCAPGFGGQAHSVNHALGSHVSLRIDHTSPQSVRFPQIVSPHTQAARPAVQLKPPTKKGQVYFGRFYLGKRPNRCKGVAFPRGGLLAEKPSE